MIESFNDLLAQADQQQDAQRLLFLFAQSEANKKTRKRDEQRGTLSAVMCVDKLPKELPSFKDLVKEADNVSKDWDMVFIAGLNGDKQMPPTSDDAEPYLNQMANDLASGQDLSRYVVFDRQENPIVIEAG